ncbi:hypothetical protein LMH87_010268 [Akanthomyces muscarius]|uniref:Uncharacterized protein n=1 Tax=Akanthomyces muscarius TaxID=2231603 RepID=A0A9W8QDF9_AKAMU|nr:hypothetical protein LMH87_010268 [Akanthomyces muscarius]KAJ4153796.1 hypothetical protein LMH87_010268 [Akanthomyces muscarius]
MLSILIFVALASAMPIVSEPALQPQNTTDPSSPLSKRLATTAINLLQRSVCESDADGIIAADCVPHVYSILRASFALFCLFAFLVLVHVWQAARYNKIQSVFGTYIADDTGDQSVKTPPYILLDETNLT